VSQKKADRYYFCDNFRKSRPIFTFFTVKFRKDLCRNLKLKLPHPLKSFATQPCKNFNYAAFQNSNSVQNDAKTFNYSKCSRGVLFLCLCRLIYHMCLKYLPSAHMHVLSRACRWSMDALVVHCSVLHQTLTVIIERYE